MEHQKIDYQYFKEVTSDPQSFFDIMQADWKVSIAPFWKDYVETARVFTLETDTEVLGGGIIFSTIPPATIDEKGAQELFDSGLLYIGFLYIKENYRGCNLGTKWLEEVRREYKGSHFWLTIDEYRLKSFYNRNGFHVVGEVSNGDWSEWVMVDKE